jgi:putative flippase GtrA
MKTKLRLPKEFIKYNVVALVATTADFTMLIFLTEILQVWYVFSAFLGAIIGGIISFTLERKWTFKNSNGTVSKQAIKYVFINICSIILNTLGLYLIVELSNIPYSISKIIIAVAVGIGFNYFTHKHYIFR